MEKINIKVKIHNPDIPYEYNGEAKKNRDIIEFEDNEFTYLFDKGISRLTKSKKNYYLILDFKNEKITIREENKELNIEIKTIENKSEKNKTEITYKIDQTKIKFEICEV